jgi:hypothetical protein
VNAIFSGHSLLDNPIPDWVQAIAVAKSDTLGWEQQNTPGRLIRHHTFGDGGWKGYGSGKNRLGSNKNMLQELASPSSLPSGERYDTLVITERNDPLNTIEYENTAGFLRHYHDRLAERSPATRTLLYQVWPAIQRSDPRQWIDFVQTELVLWECIAGKVNLSLEAEGRGRSVAVVPGGLALARALEAAFADQLPGVSGSPAQRVGAFFKDDVHLTPLGQYFIAAVLYAALFGKSPEGAHATAAVPADTALALERIAWNVASTYYQSATYLGRTMEDCRERVVQNVCPAHVAMHRLDWNPTERCQFYGKSPDSPLKFPHPESLPLPRPRDPLP